MSQTKTTIISILLVEDSDYKIKKINDFILSTYPNSQIKVSKDQITAQNLLSEEKFDLMILDMQLPVRFGESELDKSGGKNILIELEMYTEYKHPLKIVTLTQFDELQQNIRDSFPELGSIKFEANSNRWKDSLNRVIKNLINSKNTSKKIVYCEQLNDELYNLIGFSKFEFRGLKGGSRKVYEAAKFEKDKLAIRDRDYLTNNEIKWLTQSHFDNYIILGYYCFENYLYHPDNLEEYCLINEVSFDKDTYIKEIIRQKNENLLNIVQDYKLVRNGYFDFTDNEKNNMDKKPENEIVKSLQNDDLEIFYPYFDMKGTKKSKGFDKKCIEKYQFEEKKLVQTKWFKDKMKDVFQNHL